MSRVAVPAALAVQAVPGQVDARVAERISRMALAHQHLPEAGPFLHNGPYQAEVSYIHRHTEHAVVALDGGDSRQFADRGKVARLKGRVGDHDPSGSGQRDKHEVADRTDNRCVRVQAIGGQGIRMVMPDQVRLQKHALAADARLN